MGARSRKAGKGPSLGQRGLFVSVAPGLEEALQDELTELGISSSIQPGGVSLQGSSDALYRLLLQTRLGGSVTLQIGSFRMANLDQLAARIRQLPWNLFVHPKQPVEVRVTATRTRIKRKDVVAKKTEHAIADALRGPRLPGPRPPSRPVKVRVRIERDEVRVTVDGAGEPLYRRGWRKATAKAPLRENLAAALLRRAGWAPGEALVDPMCGSGTFPIEAATIAVGRAPGLGRSFAAEDFPSFDATLWARHREAARTGELDRSAPILGADRDAGAIRAATANADRAHVGNRVELRNCDVADLEPPADRGLLVINPPWGQRVSRDKATGAMRHLGDALKRRFSGWRVAILAPSPRLIHATRLELEPDVSFKSGGIPVALYLGTVG